MQIPSPVAYERPRAVPTKTSAVSSIQYLNGLINYVTKNFKNSDRKCPKWQSKHLVFRWCHNLGFCNSDLHCISNPLSCIQTQRDLKSGSVQLLNVFLFQIVACKVNHLAIVHLLTIYIPDYSGDPKSRFQRSISLDHFKYKNTKL